MPGELIGALRVSLGIDTAEFGRGMDRARKQASSGAAGIEKALSSVGRTLTGLVAGFSAVTIGRTFLDIADKAKGLDAQLKLATASFGSFNQAQEDTRRIAADTRSGLIETASLYGSFTRTAQELGSTQENAAQATETFTKALKIGGAGTAQVQSATLQMGQALASANVQWEELGQILEASPRLARVFTDALGVTRAELKKMAEDGKLSGKMLFDALNRQDITKEIDAEFRTLPKTFSEAMQQVENAALVTFGAFDQGGQFSTILSDFVTGGSEGFADLATSAEKAGIDMRATFEGLADAFEPMLEGALSAFEEIGLDSRSLARQIRDDFSIILNGIDAVRNADNSVENWIRGKVGLSPNGEAPSDFGGRYDRRSRSYANDANLRRQDRAVDRLFERANGRTPKPSQIGDWLRGEGSFGPRKLAGAAGESDADRKKREREAAAAARKAQREREEALRQQYAIDREQIDGQRDLLSAQQRLTIDYVERDKIAAELVDLDRAATEKQIAFDLAMGDINEKEAQRRRTLADQLQVLDKQLISMEQERKRQEEAAYLAGVDFSLQREALQAQSALAQTAAERREVELRILDLAYQEQRDRIARLRATGEWRDAEEAARIEASLPAAYDRDRASVMQGTRGPWEQFMASLPDTAAKANEALEAVAAGGMSSLVDGLADAIAGARSLGDVFKNVAQQIVADLIRIQLQKALVGALGNSLGGLLGLGGGSGIQWKGTAGLDTSGLPALASGGVISVLGNRGVDTNLLSINGMPAAMVNRGERISVAKNGSEQSPVTLRIIGEEGAFFAPRVAGVSRNVAVETVIGSNQAAARRGRQRLA